MATHGPSPALRKSQCGLTLYRAGMNTAAVGRRGSKVSPDAVCAPSAQARGACVSPHATSPRPYTDAGNVTACAAKMKKPMSVPPEMGAYNRAHKHGILQ